MAVKEYRRRYIVFEIDSPRPVERWEFIKALEKKASQLGMDAERGGRPWLTAFKDNRGIIRCAHTAKEEAVELLNSIQAVGENDELQVNVTTIKTSGTIKKAKSIGEIEE